MKLFRIWLYRQNNACIGRSQNRREGVPCLATIHASTAARTVHTPTPTQNSSTVTKSCTPLPSSSVHTADISTIIPAAWWGIWDVDIRVWCPSTRNLMAHVWTSRMLHRYRSWLSMTTQIVSLYSPDFGRWHAVFVVWRSALAWNLLWRRGCLSVCVTLMYCAQRLSCHHANFTRL